MKNKKTSKTAKFVIGAGLVLSPLLYSLNTIVKTNQEKSGPYINDGINDTEIQVYEDGIFGKRVHLKKPDGTKIFYWDKFGDGDVDRVEIVNENDGKKFFYRILDNTVLKEASKELKNIEKKLERKALERIRIR
jgi:hypothetical protein